MEDSDLAVQSDAQFSEMLRRLQKEDPEYWSTATADKAEVNPAPAIQQPPSQISQPIFAPQASTLAHATNHFKNRPIQTPRIPRGPRRDRPNPYGYRYRELDDPRDARHHQSRFQQVSALDYDEPPSVHNAPPAPSAAAQFVGNSLTTFPSTSSELAVPTLRPPPQQGPPLYIRPLQQYEKPISRPKGDFKGYDDLPQSSLRTIWADLNYTRKSVTNVGNLPSFEEEDLFSSFTRLDRIDYKHEQEAWSKRNASHIDFATRPTIRYSSLVNSWDQRKILQGVKLEGDSYVGPGPTRELEEAFKGTTLAHPSPQDSALEEEDVDMDASPYNDRRRDNRDNRRGGGGRNSYGGGGGNRKRGREEDEEPRDYVKRQQRPRYEEPIASKIRRDIIFIGEESLSSSPADHCAAFGRDIASNFEDDQVSGNLLDTLVAMICEQPLKIPFIAAVALYANDLNPEVSKELIARTSKKMAYALELGDWRDFKVLLRFHACLQDILEGPGVFTILNQLFEWVIDLQSSSAEDALGLELTKIILLTIPYAIASSPDAQNALGDLLDKTEIVAGEASNHPLAAAVNPFPIDGEDKPFGFQSVVEMLQQQLREEANKGWTLKCMPRPYVPSKPVATEGETGEAKPAAKHALATLSIPMPVDITKKPLAPETFFTMFAEQDIQTTPSTNDISLLLIRDTMADTISILHYNRLAVANFLTTVDQFWAPGTFATRGMTLDQVRNYPPERSKWKPEDMFIDAVFSQQLTLPDADQKLVYYHSIIFEACKLAPSAVAPTLGRGIRWLFRHVDDMDLELVYRLLDWFAHHLSNFEFRWKWTEWIGELDRSDISPKKAFIIAALDKEVRLSFAKRIRDTLPEPYYSLLTEGKFKDIPPFKYDDDATPFASEGKEIYKAMKQKLPEEQIEPYIDAIKEQALELGLDPLLASTDVYMTAMCHNGAKSVSHITAAMDRSKTRLQEARQSSAGVGRQIVESVVTYWKDQPGNAVNIIDKLLNYNIILPDSVIDWALGPGSLSNGAVLAQAWRYEVVAKTMAKVTGRVQEIAQAKVKLETECAYEPTEKLQESIPQVNEILEAERPAMRQLFATIEDAASGVASGAADGFLENPQTDEDTELIKLWGEKWLRTFRRKLAIVEARVGEAAVEAQLASAKEQYKIGKEREARERVEEEAARQREREVREARVAKEEAERAQAEAAAKMETEDGVKNGGGGDTAMDGVEANGHDDLDVAE